MTTGIKTWNDYVLLANRTAKPLEYDMQCWHAKLGLITEVGELADAYKRHEIYGKALDKVNVAEEVGDLAWYVALEFMNCRIEPYALPEVTLYLSDNVRDLLTTLSRAITYVDVMPYNLILTTVRKICLIEGLDFMGCLGLNIAKLAERYGDKYSDEAALIRNLIAERDALER